MKKILSLVAIISIVSFGCSTKSKTAYEKIDKESKYAEEFKNAPEWVLNPSSVSKFAAVGSAKIGKAGLNFARTEALANARDELARQIQVKVKNLVGNFVQTTGAGSQETVDKITRTVSKQITNQVLIGSRQKDIWISPKNELFVLVVLDKDAAKKLAKYIEDTIVTSYKNNQALWQQFQAKRGFEELDKEIQKEFYGY